MTRRNCWIINFFLQQLDQRFDHQHRDGVRLPMQRAVLKK